jgi:hypothetical protein
MVIDIMLIIHAFSSAPRFMFGLLAIEPVFPSGLDQLVDFGAGEAYEELFGECVGDRLAYGILLAVARVGGCLLLVEK